MTSYGDLKTRNGNAMLTPLLRLYLQKDSQQDVGHSSDLDQKRSGILLMKANHNENGTKSRSWWWSKFRESGHPVFRATSPQSFLLISSVTTEQSQICVKNANLAMLEQGELFRWDNLTHCLCPQVWWKHLHLRLMILHKKIDCKSTKNEWTGSHNKIVF